MLKKDVLGKASAKSLQEAFKCGECLHHKQKAHGGSGRDKPCKGLGIKAVAIAPSCFTPDVTRIAKNSDQFVQLASLVNSYTPSELRIMLAVVRGATNKKRQFRFGQKLYFKFGRDYLNNYLCGYVMGYTSSSEIIVSGSPDRKTRGDSLLAYFMDDDGLMTGPQFKVKRKELQDANKFEDPKNQVIPRGSVLDNYEPPSIDDRNAAMWKENAPKKRRRTDAVDAHEGANKTYNF